LKKGGDVEMEPFRFRNRRFIMQIPGEVILYLLMKVALLLSIGYSLWNK
jgi:hypothetical protein